MTKTSINFEKYQKKIKNFEESLTRWSLESLRSNIRTFYYESEDFTWIQFLAEKITFARILMNKNYNFNKHDL